MSSSEESEGRRLLNNWKTSGASIQISFADWGKEFSFNLVGHLSPDSTENELLVRGVGCELFLDMSRASFKNIVSKEGLKRNALPESVYEESVTVSFAGKGDFTLVTRPKETASGRLN